MDCTASGEEAREYILNEKFDCVILDLGLPDISGFELLQQLKEIRGDDLPPIIIYTARQLTQKEYQELSEYASSIVIKGADSSARLLDETFLFLHHVESKMPAEKRETTEMFHDTDTILKGRQLLLVDDDMRNSFALSKVLSKKGIKVVIASNGKIALEKLDQDDNFDLIIMDIMMPEMDGYEATRRIRKHRRYKNIPIIAVTAKAMAEDRAKCLEAGVNDCLIKPIDIDKMISMLRVWVGK